MSKGAQHSHGDSRLDIRYSKEGSLLQVRVQPRSSQNTIAGVHASALKVKVTPPAEGGRANAACLKLLAGVLSVPRSSCMIIRGEKERNKVVMVSGISPEDLKRKLEPLIP